MTDTATDLTVTHPAKFSAEIMAELVDICGEYLEPEALVLDPFAGTGKIHELELHCDVSTYAVEIEDLWAGMHPRTIHGDSTQLTELTGLEHVVGEIDAVVTSPAYGNRMADAYDGRDGSRRSTYRIALGRPLTEGNGAGMQFGPDYRRLHIAVWKQAVEMLRPGGLMVVNVKDFIRKGGRVGVTDWHRRVLTRICGLEMVEERWVETPGMRHGANHELRMDGETVLVMRKKDLGA